MIIWLASYPKSGNTWLRFFIVSLLLKENNEVSLKHLEGIKQFPTNYHFRGFNLSKPDLGNLNKICKYWKHITPNFYFSWKSTRKIK